MPPATSRRVCWCCGWKRRGCGGGGGCGNIIVVAVVDSYVFAQVLQSRLAKIAFPESSLIIWYAPLQSHMRHAQSRDALTELQPHRVFVRLILAFFFSSSSFSRFLVSVVAGTSFFGICTSFGF